MPKHTPEQLLRRVFPPMLATLADTPPKDEKNWTYELKYDGFRAISAIVEGRVAMWSRNELDLEPRFPHIAEALRKIRGPEMVLDGDFYSETPIRLRDPDEVGDGESAIVTGGHGGQGDRGDRTVDEPHRRGKDGGDQDRAGGGLDDGCRVGGWLCGQDLRLDLEAAGGSVRLKASACVTQA